MLRLKLFLIGVIIVSCATHKKQINPKTYRKPSVTASELSHRFYLIGDAGNAKLGETTLPLQSLEKRLQNAPENSSVIFLGDNVYNSGLPNRNDANYELAAHRLNTQINAVKNFKGSTVFIPGNHDYCNSCYNYLEHQEQFITSKLGEDSFLPKNGCPIASKTITNNIILITIDSQWILEDWNNNLNLNTACNIKTREDFFITFEGLVDTHKNKTIIIALHHPLLSDGPHGGQFTLQDHIFPYNNTPIPGVGHAVNFLRKHGGIYPQDTQNKNYSAFINRLKSITKNNERVVFTSGHDHSLQYFNNPVIQIVSGSGSKTSGIKRSPNSSFGYGALGYAILDIYKDDTTQIQFIETTTESDNVVFSTPIFPAYKDQNSAPLPKVTEQQKQLKLSRSSNLSNTPFNSLLFGEHYRDVYATEITAPIANLDTLFGGLTPINQTVKKQTSSLILEDSSHKKWVMQALKRDDFAFLNDLKFIEESKNDAYKNTTFKNSLEDIYTAAHPYARFAIPKLSEAISINYTTPHLYYVPKQKELSGYTSNFGDKLYSIEALATPNDSLINTAELLKKLITSHSNAIDESLYLRTRLFDMLIGDWNRGMQQWQWKASKTNRKTLYNPIPLDRTQAFSNYDGIMFHLIKNASPNLSGIQAYTSNLTQIKAFNQNALDLDYFLIQSLSLDDWLKQAEFIKTHLTDAVVDNAFNNLPKELQNDNLDTLKFKLKNRRDAISQIAADYFEILMNAVVLKATHEDDRIVITRLDNQQTTIQFYNKDTLYFENTYDAQTTTKEIWVYALDGNDNITVNGTNNNHIKLKILGGHGDDTYNINHPNNLTVHDFKTIENNNISSYNTKRRLINDYDTNTYNYKKRKESHRKFGPSIGVNKDDGLFLGVKSTLTYSSVRRNPFSHKHDIIGNYFVKNGGFNFSYTGVFGNIIPNNKRINIKLNVYHNSPNFTNNFFGFGNETVNKETFLGLQYNRVKLAQTGAVVGLIKYGLQGSTLEGTLLVESNQIENTPNRFITDNYPNTIFKRKNFIGTGLEYQFKHYNDDANPTKGLHITSSLNYRINPNYSQQQFVFLKPSLVFSTTILNSKKLVFSNKIQGHFTFGNNFEFYQAAKLGAETGLRGFRFQRFLGKHAFANSSDLSFNLKRFQSSIVPINLGVYTAFDFGRVWIKNETSNTWHNDYGMGLRLNIAELVTAKLGTYNSKEDLLIVFKLGMQL